MKFRFLLPAVFMVIVILSLAFFIEGAGGHASNPFDFVVYLMFPGCYLTAWLQVLGGPPLIWFLVCVLVSLIQYFLIGYFIDRLIAWRRKKKLSRDATK